MKLIRTTRLVRRQQSADVYCEIDLCHAPAAPNRYLVNLRQGRVGTEWRESTRTPQPVELAHAETLFALAVVDRQAQGFVDPSSLLSAPQLTPAVPAPSSTLSPARREADDALLAKLGGPHWKSLPQAQRNRLVWRIGERRLTGAVPMLVDLLERGDTMQDYCLAWAIGRCGDPGAAIAMRELHARGKSDAVRRIALQAWLQLVDRDTLRAHADALIAAWPAPIRAAWESRESAAFEQLGPYHDIWQGLSMSDWLEQLDQVALVYPEGRRLLLAQLNRVPLKANTFRAVRHIYKAAEQRFDGELFGLLHQRFETTTSSAPTGITIYAGRRWIAYTEEAARPDSTVAYSLRTRAYLLRRGWRLLRRLGEDADPQYVEMALGALEAMGDAAAGRPYQRAERHYDQYSHWLLLNAMLRSRGPWQASSSMLSWYQRQTITPVDIRQEAFPALWDARPDALLRLMQRSRCRAVHEFAARALSDNVAWCAQLTLPVVGELLLSPYKATARFAFEVCRQRFAPGVPDVEWLFLLLRSTLPEAQQYAIDCIALDPLRYCANARLVAAVACASDPNVRRTARLLCQVAATLPSQQDAIVLQLLDWLEDCVDIDDAANDVGPIADDLEWLLKNPLRDAAARAPHHRLLALLDHRLARVRILACTWLLAHEAPASAIPPAALRKLLQEPDIGVRSMGVQLFAALPDHLLVVQADLIAAFCTHSHPQMRRAVDALLQRIGPAEPAFRDALAPLLIDDLFRGETGEGVHADLLAWLTGPLSQASMLEERALLERLLRARSKGAQQLGAHLLPRFGAADFDVAQWASFGCNQNLSVREWAWAAYDAHPEQIRANMEQALRIFNTRFDDTREFAAAFFQQRCRREDWNPLLLIALCDHLDPFVQRFGRTMITKHFEVADVAEFMLKLSQHPSPAMQLFVSAWLESACAGNVTRLRELEPYFLTVLSQVHRGRVVKTRVQAFLSAQALLSEDIAAFVARLYARQVVTVAIGDKARYIEALRAIRARFPNLAEVLLVHPPAAPSSASATSEGA